MDDEDVHVEMQTRRMLLSAAVLGKNIQEIWEVYLELFDVMDTSNRPIHNLMADMLLEFEDNLIDMLTEVQSQIYAVVGVHEPVPVDIVEDFEASILRTIGNLDDIDLDSYRSVE